MSAEFSRVWRPAAWLAAMGLLVGALVLWGLAASADAQFWTRPASQPAGLQQLVEEFSAQLWYSYRGRIPEHRLRHEQLAEAIEAWNASSQSAADRQVMTTWLRDAMRASMPGSNQPMPPSPEFAGSAASTPAPTSPAPSQPEATTSNKPGAPDAPDAPVPSTQGEPTDAATGENGETEDYWFGTPAEGGPTEIAPTEAVPIEAPPGGDPFGNDPLGI